MSFPILRTRSREVKRATAPNGSSQAHVRHPLQWPGMPMTVSNCPWQSVERRLFDAIDLPAPFDHELLIGLLLHEKQVLLRRVLRNEAEVVVAEAIDRHD